MGRRVRTPMVSGPLAVHASGFEGWLKARGFARASVGERLSQFGRLSRWLESEGLTVDELTPERAGMFRATCRAAGAPKWMSERSVALPLAYLREAGVVPVPMPPVAVGPLEQVLSGYRRYLVSERGLTQATVARYERCARLFLGEREGLEGLGLDGLCAADVSVFLARECPRRSVGEARCLVGGLRSLLRYLHLAGLISAPLRWAVPGVADLRGRMLPRGLEPAVVAKLLASCDRRRTLGRRDYAIVLLLVRLGLRGGEVAAMQVDDVDWRSGEVLVRGKGGRRDRLPLPADVGEALVSYLRRRGRVDGSRALFLRVRAPVGALSVSGVTVVVRRACVRAGLPPASPHRLRHTAATEMLRAGASLPEIAQVLRHERLATTAVYAKVDRTALRSLARPWPGGAA